MSEMRVKERGNTVVIFVIISVVLAVVLVGAVYFLKQHSDQVRQDQIVSDTKEDEAAKKEAEKKVAAKKEAEKKAAAEEKKTESSSNADSNSTSSIDASSSTAIKEVKELSTTGPENNILNMAVLFFLTVAVTSFVTSHKKTSTSL